MASKKYIEARDNLIKAIDCAIEAITRYPNGRDKYEIKNSGNTYTGLTWDLKCYNESRERLIVREKKFETLQSLKYDIEDVFIYFQECAGPDVDEFWRLIKEANLPYERENKLEKILTRGRIRGRIEYDYVVDTLVPLHQEGIISDEEFQKLNEMIGKYESKRR